MGLSLVCASVGAFTVWRTDELLPGIGAFLITLVVLGSPCTRTSAVAAELLVG